MKGVYILLIASIKRLCKLCSLRAVIIIVRARPKYKQSACEARVAATPRCLSVLVILHRVEEPISRTIEDIGLIYHYNSNGFKKLGRLLQQMELV